jgi:hypothetical protein
MPKINFTNEERMPLNPTNNSTPPIQTDAVGANPSALTAAQAVQALGQITPHQVTQAQEAAGDFMIEMGSMMPSAGGPRNARENWQSMIALAGLLRADINGHLTRNEGAVSETRLSPPRDPVLSDFLKEFGARGLQLFLDVGFGFGAHQIFNQVMPSHTITGQANGAAAAPSNTTAVSNSNSPPSTDVGALFANSNALGFAAPVFVSGSAAFVANHMVGALFNTPRTTGSPGSTPLREFGHQQAQNFLFNMPGMIGGFTAANLVLSGLDAAGRNSPGAEWLLWSLGGGLGGAMGGAMNMMYRVGGMGHQVQDVDRSWQGKMKDLKNLDFQTWIKFIPAHLASLTPIQYQGTASSALIPGTSYGETLARRSANTTVLQLGFWGLHGNVQKLAQKALDLASKMGEFCNDRLHICSPRNSATESAVQINDFLKGQSQELLHLRDDLSSLLDVLHHNPERLGNLVEPLKAVEEALATMGALHTSPPATNEQGAPAATEDINRWYKEQQDKLRRNLTLLTEVVESRETSV